jgi:gluconolactonase
MTLFNLSFGPPEVIDARVLTRVPEEFRKPRRREWTDANKGGQVVHSFLEGPVFDRQGNLYVVDIPYGRIFRISPDLRWTLVVEYDGWPNGLAIHKDASIWIADYRKGLLRLDPQTGAIETILGHRNTEAFKGINDLTFDAQGSCWFTDQGQSGLQDPSGRVYRLAADGRLDCVVSGIPSPNGLVVDPMKKALFVAVTRANAVWRGPLQADGSVTKMAAFQTFFGNSGPDGLALDVEGRLSMAHGSLGGTFVMNALGEITHFLRSTEGQMVTNVAYRPGTPELVMTEAESGSILQVTLPAAGLGLYSHA